MILILLIKIMKKNAHKTKIPLLYGNAKQTSILRLLYFCLSLSIVGDWARNRASQALYCCLLPSIDYQGTGYITNTI